MKKTIIFDFYKTIYNPESDNLYKGIPTLLENLSVKFYLVLITNNNSDRIAKINKLKLDKYFKEILLVNKKQLSLYKAFSLFRSAIVIGDNPKEEIKIGKKLRLRTIRIIPSSENPTLTIRRELL